MQNIFYQPPGVWFGDCMPFGLHDTFYLFHQRDTRNPAPFGEPFGWHLSTTKDFVHYEDHGIALPRGTDEEQDQFIFAGSVFMQNDGTYRIFYTGYNRDYPTQGKPSQVLLQAVSKDALHWEKVKEAVELPPQPGYDPDDWRDPFVLWDEEKQHYLLILGTRLRGPKTRLSGRTVHFTSPDLKHWDFGGDFWAPDTFAMHEMPDLFRIGDWWYHLISEYCDKNRTVYRMAKSFYGPWLCPPDEAFDGRAYYAARTYALGEQRILFGWVPTKENDQDIGEFQWGGTFMAHELYAREDGTLGVKPPDSVWDFFDTPRTLPNLCLQSPYARKSHVLVSDTSNLFCFSCTVSFSEGTTGFGIGLYGDEEKGTSYQYHFSVPEHRFVFEKSPSLPWPAINNNGLSRPIQLEAHKEYSIRLICDDTISVLYINGVALSARMYETLKRSLSLFAENGTLSVSNISLATHA